MRIDLHNDSIWFDVIGEKERPVEQGRVVKPTLVFVHGGGGNHASARGVAHEFADIAQCIVLDLPGHGRSSIGTSERWNLASWADALADFTRALGIDRPIFHGASMGGFVVQSLAVRHPDLAGGLILVATAARRDKVITEARFRELGGTEAADAYRRSAAEPDSDAALAGFMQHCLPLYSVKLGLATASYLAKLNLLGPVERAPLAWFSRPGGEFDNFDFREALGTVAEDVLVIGGALDPVIPTAAVKDLHASFRNGVARLELLPGASHLVPVDDHDGYLRAVRDFLIPKTTKG